MPDIAFLDTRTQPFPIHEREPLRSEDLTPIDQYALPETDLVPFCGLIIGGASDQEFMLRHREVVRAFLDDGKVVAFSGHLFRPWLPGCGLFVPKRIRSVNDFKVSLVAQHPVFKGVDERDLTFRRGVAGFFARGHHPPPDGAEVIATLAPDEPVVYVDRKTTRGVIVAHSGNDLLGYADGGTAGRIVPQLLRWMREEGRRR